MVDISILVENRSIDKKFRKKHGLSLLINRGDSSILLDTGPDSTFIKNAALMNKNLSAVKHLVLSHSHVDHTGGLDAFAEINNVSSIYLADSVENRYFFRLGFLFIPVGIKANPSTKKRIKEISSDTEIADNAWIIMNRSGHGFRPSLNRYLYMKKDKQKVHDTFEHESTLVVADGNELVVFNSCSHSGVSNIIETVRKAFPGRHIRSFVGGMHLCNPGGSKTEELKDIERLASELSGYDIIYYTGHCTGEIPFSVLQGKLGNRIQKISTGMELSV